MATYPSKSSNSVKAITIVGILILILITISLIFIEQDYNLTAGII